MPSLGQSLRAGPSVSGGAFFTPGVEYLARENNTLAGGFAVSNWSLTTNPKKLNPANRYGTSGYYQIRPGASDVYDAVGGSNNLGITSGSQPTLYSHPSFATVSGYAGAFVNFGGYPSFLQNDGVTPIRQGALSVSVNQGPYTSPSGTNRSYVAPAFDVTMTQSAIFLLGIAVDTANDRRYAPKYVSVQLSGVTVFSAAIPTGPGGTSIPRFPIFLIRGKAGNVFTVGLWHDGIDTNNDGVIDAPNPDSPVAPFSLITFDKLI